MKKIFILLLAVPPVYLAACNNGDPTSAAKKFPAPGTLVAADTMPVTEDALNHFMFSVKVIADSDVASGVYDVDADFGPNFATSKFTMPKGGENFLPVIRKGNAPYTYIIGFRQPGDTTFYDYFEVSSDRHNTRMQYIKAYTF